MKNILINSIFRIVMGVISFFLIVSPLPILIWLGISKFWQYLPSGNLGAFIYFLVAITPMLTGFGITLFLKRDLVTSSLRH